MWSDRIFPVYTAGDKTGEVSVDQYTELTLLAELVVPEKKKDSFDKEFADAYVKEMRGEYI